MEKEMLWDKHLDEQFISATNKELEAFLELLSYISDNNISNKLSYELYENPQLWDWLTSRETISLRDIKKELSIKMNKAQKINEQEYRDIICSIGVLNDKRVMILAFNKTNAYYIYCVDDYYNALRKYLIMEKKDDFCRDMLECFPNIYFTDDIASTINTLNRKFEELREEIVEHLIELNNYHTKFLELLSQNKSNQVIAQKFYEDTGIDCSPQSSRNNVRELKIACFNEINNRKEVINCELHTKFNKHNIDRTKQDRIYFFPGRQGIHEGKIIVKHIGKHL
ncbi:MAG: hypothetical protein IJ336_10430 [Lachnospiraceae bacterium]|nr:hypothetical protein [Lachnospiraceae bacterium]